MVRIAPALGVAAACAAVPCAAARAQSDESPHSGAPSIAAAVVSEDMYPPQPATFRGGVTGLPDLTYTTELGFRPVKLDLYLPPSSFDEQGPRPVIVYVHGGGWLGGSARTTGAFANWPEALASIAARGYVVASIDYRLAREAPFPAAVFDVKDAIRWLRSNAAAYNIDRHRVLIWGSSAGGQLAALAATTCGVADLDRPVKAHTIGNAAVETNQPPPAASESACVQAAVIWYGVSDFKPLGSMAEAAEFLGCQGEKCAKIRRDASPVSYVNSQVPPFLIIHGTEDQTVPVQQARTLHDAIKAQNGKVELLLLPGIDHSFLGKTADATQEASRRAWERTVGFIERTFVDTEQEASQSELDDGL